MIFKQFMIAKIIIILTYSLFAQEHFVISASGYGTNGYFNMVDTTGLPTFFEIDSINTEISDLFLDKEIGIFDSSLCVGVAIWNGTSPFHITVWRGDESMGLEGSTPGNPIRFYLYSNNEEGDTVYSVESSNQSSGDYFPDGPAYYIEYLKSVEISTDFGCIDLAACNYFSDAFIDDGSCLNIDCAGDCGGSAVEDECGVCDGNGSSCCDNACSGETPDCDGDGTCVCDAEDCAGLCGGTATTDNCGDCVGGDTGSTACVQDCADEWGGDAENEVFYYDFDDDGLGAGNGHEFCSANPPVGWVSNNDDLEPNCHTNNTDECNVCDDDPSNDCTQDCSGLWGGNAVADECGTCYGNGCHLQNCTTYPSSVYDCNGNLLSIFDGIIPKQYSIHNIYPNPFNPVTNITYGLPEYTKVNIIIYDLSGKQVATLINQFQTPGYHSVNWDADNLPSGVYLIRMDSGDFTQTQKVVLVK